MIDEKLVEALEAEDFIVNIRPTILKSGKWSGDVNVSIMIGRDNPLDDEDYSNLLHFAKMICSTVPMMEYSEELREMVNDYVLKNVDNDKGTDLVFKPDNRGKILDRKDNVVTVSFGTETKGSA
tara:strand:+ start:10451 stop:10822 length:372 start_codon:yes stop_codon:yes gene_type:complete